MRSKKSGVVSTRPRVTTMTVMYDRLGGSTKLGVTPGGGSSAGFSVAMAAATSPVVVGNVFAGQHGGAVGRARCCGGCDHSLVVRKGSSTALLLSGGGRGSALSTEETEKSNRPLNLFTLRAGRGGGIRGGVTTDELDGALSSKQMHALQR